ncbi:uncharacterized protein E0L32_004338 [Thyridium curvatum]|uniref:F-box domain-containing protein n=1 Tax=Thyridium curvatum TaxID=1093900 RepID=A0A507BGH0_9PEZI|nr:uncharacterized protein E0L32_004338 [Thyridium curvatum]TPX15640.1 hypothetical protein E0L32_004338 [Thyridium curvatum]
MASPSTLSPTQQHHFLYDDSPYRSAWERRRSLPWEDDCEDDMAHQQQPGLGTHLVEEAPRRPSAPDSYFDLGNDSSAPYQQGYSYNHYPSSRPSLESYPRRRSDGSDISSASTASQSLASRTSFQSHGRSSSWSSRTSFDSYYSTYSTPATSAGAREYDEFPWQRPSPIKQQRRRKARPGELFAALPGEVLELILAELRELHLAEGSKSCATCWMRNVCAVSLSARKWVRFARAALYQNIQLIGDDSAHHRKRYKSVPGTRIMLLRRTLRANPTLASLVRSVKVPPIPQGVKTDDYEDMVASLVMACPELERLEGFYPSYDHSFKRLFNALSTRRNLKQMTWIVDRAEPAPMPKLQKRFSTARQQKPDSWRQSSLPPLAASSSSYYYSSCPQPRTSNNFLDLHARWQQLTTLTVHFQPGAAFAPASAFADSLRCLPSLRDLHVSRLPAAVFGDAALLALPASLRKLSLAHVAGVTSAGLAAFATAGGSGSGLRTLTLVHTELDSLPALARVLANLARLETFSLVQARPPLLPRGEIICLYPYLASASLRSLHWDFTAADGGGDTIGINTDSTATAADAILARSIAAGGFPALRRLRAPRDPGGMFQALCRPAERVDLPTDKFQTRGAGSVDGDDDDADDDDGDDDDDGKERGRGGKSPPRLGNDLLLARLAAQARVEAARRQARMRVDVVDERGVLAERFGMGGYIGTVGSRVRYHLLPDEGGRDEKGGLVDMGDLLGDCGEALVLPRPSSSSSPQQQKQGKQQWKQRGRDRGKGSGAGGREKGRRDKNAVEVREGCTGRWNTWAGPAVDKKDMERWWHTERGRWRSVELS